MKLEHLVHVLLTHVLLWIGGRIWWSMAMQKQNALRNIKFEKKICPKDPHPKNIINHSIDSIE